MTYFRTLTALSLALATTLTPVAANLAHAQEIFDENGELPANPDIEAQVNGEFPKMDRSVPPPLGALQRAWDNADIDAGITRFKYEPGRSFKIMTREAMTTTIRLPEWESIESIILGDQSIYRTQQLNDNTLEVWTTIPGSDTSLKVLGDSQNIYSFYVRSETYNSGNLPDLTVYIDASAPAISTPANNGPTGTTGATGPTSMFTTGAGVSSQATLVSSTGASPNWLRDLGFDPTRIKRDRALFGDAELAPDDIFRDDQFTYLCFGEAWDDSSLMVAAPYEVGDGVDRQVNFRVSHNCMIVETTGPLTFRRGDKVLCVRPDTDKVTPRRSAAAARVRPLLPQETSAPAAGDLPAPSAVEPTAEGAASATTTPSVAPLPPTQKVATDSTTGPDLRPKKHQK